MRSVRSGWREVRLKHVIDSNPTKSEVRGLPDSLPVSFIPMDAVGEHGGLDLSQEKSLGEVFNGYTYFRDGDVVVAKITPCFENRKGALARRLCSGLAFGTTELHVLRPRKGLDARFLFYLTMSDRFRRLGEASMYGAGGQKRISEEFIEEYRTAIPPLDYQRAIASFLDRETIRIDTLLEKKQRLLDLLEEKRTALITQAVTRGLDPDVPMRDSGVEWIGEIPEHWEVARIRHLCTVGRGASPRPIEDPKYFAEDGEYGWVRIEDVTRAGKYLTETRQYLSKAGVQQSVPLSPGSLILSIAASVGKAVLLNQHFCVHDGFVYFSRLRQQPGYWYYIFRSGSPFIGLGKLGTQLNLNTDTVGDIVVPIPPDSEQRRIEEELDKMDWRLNNLGERVGSAISLLREYRSALISSAVTGQIDVTEPEPVPA